MRSLIYLLAAVAFFSSSLFTPVHATNLFERAAKELDRALQQKRPASKRAAPERVNEPRMSRETRRQVQHALNLLGFDAGKEDGILGQGTRKAISAFQRSSNQNATGFLTASQLDMLLNAGAAAEASNAAAENELTSQQIRTLQTNLRALGLYRSDIDGSYNEVTDLAVRSFLRKQGRNPDTVSAWEAFVLVAKTMGVDMESANADAGASVLDSLGAKAPAQTAGSADTSSGDFTKSDYAPATENTGFNLQLEISRRALAAKPDYLDERRAAETWIKTEFPQYAYGKRGSASTPDTLKFYEGTEFDRKDAVNSLREVIQANATDAPLKFHTALPVRLRTRDFEPAKGIPLGSTRGTSGAVSNLESLTLYLDHVRRSIEFVFPNAPDVSHIPVGEQRARQIATLLNDNPYNELEMRVYITLQGVQPTLTSQDREGRFQAIASLDAAEILIRPRKGSGVTEPTALFTWVLAGEEGNAVASGSETPTEYARWLDIPLTQGHLTHFDNFNGLGIPLSVRKQKANAERWNKLQLLSHLEGNPSLLDDDELLLLYADATLSTADKQVISKGKALFPSLDPYALENGYAALNEFEQHAAKRLMRKEYSEKILAKSPGFPLPVVEITQAVVRDYDFDREGFLIDWEDSGITAGNAGVFQNFNIKFRYDKLRPQQSRSNFKNYPDILKVPPEKAEQLANLLENKKANRGHRYIYLAVFTDLPSPKVENERLLFDFQAKRAALFADIDLKELIAEIPVSNGWPSPATVTDMIDPAGPVPLTPDTAFLWVAKTQPNILEDQGFLVQAFERRLKAERKYSEEKLFVQRFIPKGLVNGETKADERDYETFKSIYRAMAEKADFSTIRMAGGVRAGRGSDGGLEINLDTHFKRNLGQSAEPLKAARRSVPQGIDQYLVQNESFLPVVLVNTVEKEWYGVAFPFPTNAQADEYGHYPGYIDLDVNAMQVVADASNRTDRPVMVVSVSPRSVAIGSGDQAAVYAFGANSTGQYATANPDYEAVDIREIRLGMTLEEAAEMASTAESGLTRQKIGSTTPHPYRLTDGLELFRLGRNWNEMVFVLLTAPGQENGEVIAIGNVQNYEDKTLDVDGIAAALAGKYGEPDYTYSYHRGATTFAWIINPDSRKRVAGKVSDSDCYLQANRSLYLSHRGGLARKEGAPMLITGEVKADCGVVLTAIVDEHGSATLLYDTSRILAVRKEVAETLEAAKNKKAEESSVITKF